MREISKTKTQSCGMPFYDHNCGLDMVINVRGRENIHSRKEVE